MKQYKSIVIVSAHIKVRCKYLYVNKLVVSYLIFITIFKSDIHHSLFLLGFF